MCAPRAWNTQVYFSDMSKDTFPSDLVIRVAPFTQDRCLSRQLCNSMGRRKMALAMISDSSATYSSILASPAAECLHGAIIVGRIWFIIGRNFVGRSIRVSRRGPLVVLVAW